MALANGGAAGVEPMAAAVTAARLFAGPGEMRARCRALDWAATSLGPVERWPASLRTVVGLVLAAPTPMILLWGPELVQIYNDGYAAIMGAKHPAGLAQRNVECWPEVWDFTGPVYAGVREGGKAFAFTDQHLALERHGHPEETFFTLAYSPVFDETGAVGGVLVTVLETTAQVRARGEREIERERLLAEVGAERERLRALVLQMPAPVALHEGPEHRYVLINDAYQRIGGTWRDVVGRTPPEAFPELVGSGVFECLDRVYATGEPWIGPETPLSFDRDGTGRLQDAWFTIRFEPVRDAAGRVAGIINFSLDVTEQVRARAQVETLLPADRAARAEAEAAGARAEAVLASIADAFYLLDRSWRFTYVNDAAEPLLQTTRERLLGRTLWEAFPGVVGSPFEGPYREAMATGRPTSAEAYFPPLGTWFDVHTYAWSGGLMVHFRDIGARKAADAERERLLTDAEAARHEADDARGAAEAANQAKSQFLAVMSHELRTPLNAIGGYAELLELGIYGPITDGQQTALARIQASQRHLLGLIAGVLDYSRVEAGAVTYRIVDVPVTEAVAEAETLVAPQLRAKGLGYAWSGAAPGLAVRADREKLQQILLNLLGNAVKFTHPREGVPGRIEVACTVARAAGGDTASGEEADGDAAADQVSITVRDTGEGIAAEQLARVFEPFVQADQRFTRPHEGVGLGLAISRDLARGMGGDLTAESTPGLGSTFTLTLPRSGTPRP